MKRREAARSIPYTIGSALALVSTGILYGRGAGFANSELLLPPGIKFIPTPPEPEARQIILNQGALKCRTKAVTSLVRRLAPGAVLTMKRTGDRQSDRIILDIRILSVNQATGGLYMQSAPGLEVRSLEMEVQMALKIGEKILNTREGTKSVPEPARASEPGQMTRERK